MARRRADEILNSSKATYNVFLLKINSVYLDRYIIQSFLGRGGYGEVYLARDQKLPRLVAVKIVPARILDDIPHMLGRFKNEMCIMASLNHPNIVTIHDAGIDANSNGYIIMELMAGGTVNDAISEHGQLPWSRVKNIGLGLCNALSKIHKQGIVHRDVKPQNIMFQSGERKHAKLGDFGIAHIPGGFVKTSMRRLWEIQPGTLIWMSPEQIQGKKPTSQTDIYALGATLYFMLTGRMYYVLPSIHNPYLISREIVEEEFFPLDRIISDLPIKMVEVVHRSLEKDPALRFPSAEEFGHALSEIETIKVSVPSLSKKQEVKKERWRTDIGQLIVVVPKRPRMYSLDDFEIDQANPGDVWIWPEDGAEMVFVPAGVFRMGSNNGLASERPERDASTDAYLIDKYSVTNARYKKFIDSMSNYPVPRADAEWAEFFNWDPVTKTYPPGQDDYPVILISFNDARAYCAWAHKRLPTEIEWEKAACWEPATGQRRLYPWGDNWDPNRANSAERIAGKSFPPILDKKDEAYAWFQRFRELDRTDPFEANTYELLTKVYMYPSGASALGVMDMAGNVHEWCEAHLPLRCPDGNIDPAIKPEDLLFARACRGAAWADHPFYLRTSCRLTTRGSSRYDRIGFRCVASIKSNIVKLD